MTGSESTSAPSIDAGSIANRPVDQYRSHRSFAVRLVAERPTRPPITARRDTERIAFSNSPTLLKRRFGSGRRHLDIADRSGSRTLGARGTAGRGSVRAVSSGNGLRPQNISNRSPPGAYISVGTVVGSPSRSSAAI